MRETNLPARLETQGLIASFTGSGDFSALVAREREKWARVVREAGITFG
jgi:tripartite-type tricarboxylate transporter receptor subunit TctC